MVAAGCSFVAHRARVVVAQVDLVRCLSWTGPMFDGVQDRERADSDGTDGEDRGGHDNASMMTRATAIPATPMARFSSSVTVMLL